MKRIYLLLTLIVLINVHCSNKTKSQKSTPDVPTVSKEPLDSVPSCVRKLIEEGAKTTPPTTPIKVDEYSYNGKKVYLFTADCCDFFNTAYDQDCKPICAPSGGFTGKGDMKCPDFSNTAKLVKLIWKKPS